ncbi:gliding motility-associated C-terminal domain-containing protein [Pedobacter sp. ASV28]|uniref:T9SS type B sorting domain-containing protein n=1 Tax=Pedobacter sp. ASV28 TaxID=2795123 RepID=UPI0018EC161B|nr:gliding motility-associated C-terminal domain-containing protein [Pedobacter sp. ASV28]
MIRLITWFILISLFFFTPLFSQDLPIPDWVKDIGGTGESKLAGIGVDKNDNIYVAGNFQGTLTVDHSGVSSPINFSSNGNYDIFIAKYTPDGKLLWAKSIGGSGLDQVNNLAVDLNGNVIIGASFSSPSIDCNPGPGVYTINSNGGEDALVVKLDTDGNFIWARSVGSFSTDRGHVVTTDKDGNVIFVGSFSSSSITISGNTLANRGSYDGFVVKYNPIGDVLWSAGFGSTGMDEIKSVKTDSNGSIALMGYFGANINLNPRGVANHFTASGETYFIAQYTSNGILEWANKIDGSSSRTVASISIGPTNDLFATGVFSGSINFNSANLISLNSTSAISLFVAKYDNSGKTIWARGISSTASNPYSYYITVDNENNAYIGGFFDQTLTFNPGTAAKVLTSHGGRDTFFAKYDSNGGYKWAFNFGSSCTGNFGHKIDVDSKKNVLLGGAFCRTVDFNPGNCDLNLTAKHGNSDGYISKFNQIKLTGEPLITKFELDEQNGPTIIDVINKKITITVKTGTNIRQLKPKIETDIGVLDPLSAIETDFSTPKIYKITSNCIDYFWEVNVNAQNTFSVSSCSGENVILNGESSSPGNYQWEMLVNNIWSNAPANSTQVNYQTNNLTNFTNSNLVISFRRKNTSNNPSTYDSYTSLLIYPAIQNNLVNIAQNIFCSSATLSISGSTPSASVQASFTYKWQKSLDNITWIDIFTATGKDYTPPEFTETTFFRRVATINNCISYSNSLKVDVFMPPTVSISGNPSGCSSATLIATGGTSYQWSGGLTPSAATNTFTTSGTYTVTVTNAEGCSATLSKTVTIGIGQTNITGNTTGCNKVTLTASGGVTYLWDGGSTPNSASNTFNSSGTYHVTITDANGCMVTLQKDIIINTSLIPSLSISASKSSICAGAPVIFTPLYASAGTNPTFKWFKNGIQATTSRTYTANGLKDNDEIYCEIAGSDACSVPFISNKIVIAVSPLPLVYFEGDIIIENDGPKTLKPQTGNDVLSYSWSPTIGLDYPNIKHPKVNPESTTIYTLIVTGPGGCTAQAEVKVIVWKDIFIPNVFSPNGDGKNDQWVIRNIKDYIGTTVKIFNRYGQKVFENNNFITPWDGIFNGKPLPVGNYYYILQLANQSKRKYTGSVTILR